MASILLSLLLALGLYCCRIKSGRRVTTLVNVYAPVEWVWHTFPQQYEMSKIYGVTQEGQPFKDGIF